jgi:membrane protein YqaA with SNARE-associated domain
MTQTSACGQVSLCAVNFAESALFPIPSPIMLAPMTLSQPHRVFRLTMLATMASVLGGMLGYSHVRQHRAVA